ncbi:MAG: hypothetical protein EZS28_034625 [Streblomastix strix]|uniref:Uncharacterized protein n=1 Tax=Streblomastix strix TaxID=222440 RepID=A0A5J4UH38_9EUKA|nr:MAG: hypothetical protein EZS28_034625 [Streblomastix strix]
MQNATCKLVFIEVQQCEILNRDIVIVSRQVLCLSRHKYLKVLNGEEIDDQENSFLDVQHRIQTGLL